MGKKNNKQRWGETEAVRGALDSETNKQQKDQRACLMMPPSPGSIKKKSVTWTSASAHSSRDSLALSDGEEIQ